MNIAIIPARGGSQRIPRKNIRPFCGRPMIEWVIETSQASRLFDRIVVSTDDEEVASVARAAGAEVPFVRPPELSDHHSGTIEVIAHAVRWGLQAGWSVSSVCCLYPTAAFVLPADLLAARDAHESGGWDYVFAAGRFERPVQRAFFRGDEGAMRLLFPEHRLTRTQDLPPAFFDAGQFYWGSVAAWGEQRPIFGERSTFVELPAARAIDIDIEDDWAMAEQRFIEWKQITSEQHGRV
jgi:pseudaminic acid cytidylyltransferase